MKSCILPFTLDVEMRASQNKAFPLGVFKANIQDYEIWLCNRLINSIYRANGRIDAYHEGIWSVDEELTFMQTLKLKTIAYIGEGINIITLNKEMLNTGAYITGYCNEFYIKGKSAYQEYDFNRDYLLIGYDDEKKVFKSVGYLADGSYKYYDIGYDSYYRSVVGRKAERSHIEYYQVNKEYSAKLDIVSIKQKLINYLYSQKDIMSLDPEAYCYGIAVWDNLVNYISKVGQNDLSNRSGRFYMEHRAVMVKRFQKLYELGYLKNRELVDEYYKNVSLPAKSIHYSFIKYNLIKEEMLLSKIIDTMKRINETEKIIIEKILSNF